jgi:hypothetical protein
MSSIVLDAKLIEVFRNCADSTVLRDQEGIGAASVKYRIIWDPQAFLNLRRAWLATGQSEAALRAFDEIEQMLGEDAHLQGESRESDRRILLVPPLGVRFYARPEMSEVFVFDAWLFTNRKS